MLFRSSPRSQSTLSSQQSPVPNHEKTKNQLMFDSFKYNETTTILEKIEEMEAIVSQLRKIAQDQGEEIDRWKEKLQLV